jgi:hypothetical protein
MNLVSSLSAAACSNSSAIWRKRSASAAAARGAAGDQPFQFAAQFQHLELAADVDLRHDDAALGQDRHQPFARQPVQRFADRRAADAQARAQAHFGHRAARWQLHRHDQFFQFDIGFFGQALRRIVVRLGRRFNR